MSQIGLEQRELISERMNQDGVGIAVTGFTSSAKY